MGLAFVNRDANDNHIEVVNLIADKHFIPEKNDCWSCYQPKLYYLAVTGVVKLLHYHVTENRIITAQMLNVIFAFFSLLLIWKFIRKQVLSTQNQLLLFAFCAFNPCFAAINIQATNDTLAILFGIAALYFADSFFKESKKKYFIGLSVAVVAAALTKGSGLLLFTVILIAFILKLAGQYEKQKRILLVKYLLILIFSFSAIVPFAGGYYNNYKKYHSFTVSTWNKDAPPLFFKTSYIARPGITDMFHGWFTFRYLDMIRQPYINNESDNYPLHRTSLWSQLYGRTMFLHFDQWPESWQTQESWIISIGRALIILGIVPLFLFLCGFVFNCFAFLKSAFTGFKNYLQASTDYLHLISAVVFLMSSLVYTYSYRDFSAMKSIYIFPGIISFVKLFSDGFVSIIKIRFSKLISVALLIIIILSIVDISYLFYQQYSIRYLER